MSANHVSDTKDKYVAYIKNLQNSTVTKPNSPIRKWAKDMKSYFTAEDTQMAYKHTKRYSASLAIRERQRKKNHNEIWWHTYQDRWNKEEWQCQMLARTAGENVKWYGYSGKQFGSFLSK